MQVESAAGRGDPGGDADGQPPTTKTGRESRDLSGLTPNAHEVAATRLAEFNERLRAVPVGDRATWGDAARDGAGILSAWARLDAGNAAELNVAAAAMARSAQLRRAPLGAGRRVKESPMGTALILLAAKPGTDQDKIAGAVLLRQVLKTAEALRDHHRAAGQLGEAQRLQQQVLDRLQRMQLVGYATTATAPQAAMAVGEAARVPVGEAQRTAQEAQRLSGTLAPKGRPSGSPRQPAHGPLPRPLSPSRAPYEPTRTQPPGRSESGREGRE